MINAIILINTARGKVTETAEQLAALQGVSEVYSVCGRYDLVAIVRVASFDDLADLVNREMARFDGIQSTETLNAMQVHSRHDLETMFSVGL